MPPVAASYMTVGSGPSPISKAVTPSKINVDTNRSTKVPLSNPYPTKLASSPPELGNSRFGVWPCRNNGGQRSAVPRESGAARPKKD